MTAVDIAIGLSFLCFVVLLILNLMREREELLASRRPAEWEETRELWGYAWRKGDAELTYVCHLGGDDEPLPHGGIYVDSRLEEATRC